MSKTTPEKINQFWKKRFKKPFSNMKIRFDHSTLNIIEEDGQPSKVTIMMYSDYYNLLEQKQYTNEKSRYVMKCDDDFRIMYLVQEVYK